MAAPAAAPSTKTEWPELEGEDLNDALTLERCPNLALASAFFVPGTREAFSPCPTATALGTVVGDL